MEGAITEALCLVFSFQAGYAKERRRESRKICWPTPVFLITAEGCKTGRMRCCSTSHFYCLILQQLSILSFFFFFSPSFPPGNNTSKLYHAKCSFLSEPSRDIISRFLYDFHLNICNVCFVLLLSFFFCTELTQRSHRSCKSSSKFPWIES